MAQFTLTATDTAPKGVLATGSATSYTTSRVIEGSGTSWLGDVDGGDFLHDRTNDQIRQVDYVVSDTEIILKEAFATAINNTQVYVVKGDAKQISVAANGGDIAIKDKNDNTSTIYDGSSLTPTPDIRDAVAPFIIKATTAASAVCTTTP